VPYCHLWSVGLNNIFPHYLMNGTILGEKKCVFLLSLQILSETILILGRIQRDIILNVNVNVNVNRSSGKVSNILFRLKNCFFFSTDLRKIPKHQISLKSFLWEPVGRTDRHDEANRRFPQCCELPPPPQKKRPPGTPMCKHEQIVNWILLVYVWNMVQLIG
jgi:hypothetical protein